MGIPPALFRGAGGVLLGLVVDLRALPIDKLSGVGLMLLLCSSASRCATPACACARSCSIPGA